MGWALTINYELYGAFPISISNKKPTKIKEERNK
jgi:hypothetical protein